MKTDTLNHFKSTIINLTETEVQDAAVLAAKLQMANDGALKMVYTPFEYVNPKAKVALVGITPGNTQLVNAVAKIRECLKAGQSDEAALQAAKKTGAFSGGMRDKLIEMLNCIGLNRYLSINDCAELFGDKSHLVQTCSVIKNATYALNKKNGKWDPYNGVKGGKITKPQLKQWVFETFGEEVKEYPEDILFIPMGPVPEEALSMLVKAGAIKAEQVLDAIPHPSGANNERIAFFLGQKTSGSKQCSQETIDAYQQRRETLIARLKAYKPA